MGCFIRYKEGKKPFIENFYNFLSGNWAADSYEYWKWPWERQRIGPDFIG